MTAREIAGSVVLFVKLSVTIALLGIALGLLFLSKPADPPADDLPDRATRSAIPEVSVDVER